MSKRSQGLPIGGTQLSVISENTYTGTWRAVVECAGIPFSATYAADGLAIVRTTADGHPDRKLRESVEAVKEYAERRVAALPRRWHMENRKIQRTG